jgi:hypothetical protein
VIRYFFFPSACSALMATHSVDAPLERSATGTSVLKHSLLFSQLFHNGCVEKSLFCYLLNSAIKCKAVVIGQPRALFFCSRRFDSGSDLCTNVRGKAKIKGKG